MPRKDATVIRGITSDWPPAKISSLRSKEKANSSAKVASKTRELGLLAATPRARCTATTALARSGRARHARWPGKDLFHDRLLRGMQEDDPSLPREGERLLKLCRFLDYADAAEGIRMSVGIRNDDRRKDV